MEGYLVSLIPEFGWRMIGATIITMTDVVEVAEFKTTATYGNNLEKLDILIASQKEKIDLLAKKKGLIDEAKE